MKPIPILIGLAMLIAGCATQVVPLPTSGSRADGVVNLSYEYGMFQSPQYNASQALTSAIGRCRAWGYTSAEPFGGIKTECNMRDLYGDCARYFATIAYQCTSQTSVAR
jgi:hypothetical protein